jgi:enamine deaminase RidA (YjgF/YER057c/UK114 family)
MRKSGGRQASMRHCAGQTAIIKKEQTVGAEDRIKELGIELSAGPAPVANYVPAVRTGNLVFLSGQLPTRPDGSRIVGRLGVDVEVQAGYEAARVATIGLLGRLKDFLGSLDNVVRVVKVNGYVNSAPDFQQQPQVINGASDLLVEVFGEAGKHARAAVSAGALPFGAAVEVELIVEVAP